jgi:ATP-binding cassette subfamily B protein RaxB
VETQKGIITLKANNMEQARDAVMDKSQREHIAGLMRKERLLARFDVASLLVINAEQLLVVCFGAWLILEGQMSIGMLTPISAINAISPTRWYRWRKSCWTKMR